MLIVEIGKFLKEKNRETKKSRDAVNKNSPCFRIFFAYLIYDTILG